MVVSGPGTFRRTNPSSPSRGSGKAGGAVHHTPDAGRHEGQAGRRRDRSRHLRHPAAAGGRAESRRLLHRTGPAGRVTTRRPSTAPCEWGIIQGGDPLSKDPAKRAMYGTGGLGMLAQEFNSEPVTRGAVAAVLQPGKPDSAGSQFFVAVTDQVALNGTVTVFGRVVEGLEVVQAISEAPVDEKGRVTERIEILSVDHPRRAAAGTGAVCRPRPWRSWRKYRAVIETTEGAITITFDPVKAPRARPQLPAAGLGRGLRRHQLPSDRQGLRHPDRPGPTREKPLTQRQLSYVTDVAARVQRHPARGRHRLDGPHRPIRPARRPRFSSARRLRPRSTTPTRSLAGSSAGWGSSRRSRPSGSIGETPVERVDLIRVRLEKDQK